uniref:Nuclear transport factor 2 family protein n=1 Tax=Streptomyces sp. NBC_00049 TaxID=2903617 RepID=A0AAU2JIW0_9ACTN
MLTLPSRHTAAIALAAATAALTLTFVTSASASPDAAAPQPDRAAAAVSVSGSPEGAFTRIADFYGSYIDAVYDGDGQTADRLRAFYLSGPLQAELKRWEETHHADGVLRAQNVPLGWKVTSTGNGMGKANATVTLTWGGETTRILVQADLATRKIVSVKG